MIYKGYFMDPWAHEAPVTKLTLIGKNLDHEALRKAFMRCLATEENDNAYKDKLRFQTGDRVECNSESGWSPGVIVQLAYREPEFGVGFLAPYQVSLDNGRLIFCPSDDDMCIRLAAEQPPAKKAKH